MKGYKPDDADFNFVSGGYKCAVGISKDTPDTWGIIMVKQKAAGGATETFQDWELVHAWDYAESLIATKYNGDYVKMFNEFGKEAAPKLKAMTGGTIPAIPNDVAGRLFWHVRYRLAFRPESFEVYHQG